MQGGVVKGGLLPFNSLSVTNNAVIHGSASVNNLAGGIVIQAGGCFADGAWTIAPGSAAGATGTFWGSFAMTLNPGAVFWNTSGSTFAAKALLTTGALKLGANTTGFTSPNCGTFTLNGVNAVNVAPASGHFPAGSTISWSLNTVGGTPGTAAPFFATTAVIQDQFTVKSPTAGANDVYNWCALPASVSITAANLDLFNGLQDINTGARFSNTQ